LFILDYLAQNEIRVSLFTPFGLQQPFQVYSLQGVLLSRSLDHRFQILFCLFVSLAFELTQSASCLLTGGDAHASFGVFPALLTILKLVEHVVLHAWDSLNVSDDFLHFLAESRVKV